MDIRIQNSWIGLFVAGAALLLGGCGDQHPVEYEQIVLPPPSIPKDIGATVRIEGGTFTMGAPSDAKKRPSSPNSDRIWVNIAWPPHKEVVKSFEIGKYEVTATEFCAFLNEANLPLDDARQYIYMNDTSTVTRNESGYQPRVGYEYADASHVQIRGARKYCEWMSAKTGKRYRLPTEIEWEFAARGPQNRTYPWGEDINVARAFIDALYRSTGQSSLPGVLPVGQFPAGATPEGVQDLIGTSQEWCANCFYDYSNETIGADPERFKGFANPSDDGLECVTKYTSVPQVAVRGGQYVDRLHPATGWSRHGMPARKLDPGEAGWLGYSFRILRELP